MLAVELAEWPPRVNRGAGRAFRVLLIAAIA